MSSRLKICLTVICTFLQICLFAQIKTIDYIKEVIPDSLIKGADVVCRLDEQEVEIFSPEKMTVRRRHIYTILNDNAEKYAGYGTHYNKLTSINYVDGFLYNSAGKEMKHFKKKDMSDFAENGEAFVSDDRMKVSGFTFNSYPHTVDFEDEVEEAGVYNIPRWSPPRSDKMSLLLSRYILTVPENYKFRYKIFNTNVKPVIIQKKDKITYIWEVANLPVIPEEPYSVASDLYDPFMLLAPSDFAMEGYSGNMSDWKEFGKFYLSLQKDRDILPDDLKAEVHKLTDNVNDPYKKIAILYDYLQKNTHYVLIMFGIGGLQPYDANYVAKNKYGDCKALSNFMVALLKESGITANAVLIWGGEEVREFVPDFPCHQFNHVICAVPLEKDTVWLECTSQSLPPGYLGGGTANRYGLLINDNGGTLVHTPAYLLKDNTSVRKIFATVSKNGDLSIKSETDFKALSHDYYQSLYNDLSKEEQLEYLKKELNLPTYNVNSFDYKEDHSKRLPVIHESLDLSVMSYAHVTEKRIFIKPDILRESQTMIPEEKDRKLDFLFKKEYTEIDSIEIIIPDGYSVESQPKDIFIKSKLGKYQTHTSFKGNKIFYFRQLDRFSGQFPANAYEEIRTFYNNIYNGDHAQIVFSKINND